MIRGRLVLLLAAILVVPHAWAAQGEAPVSWGTPALPLDTVARRDLVAPDLAAIAAEDAAAPRDTPYRFAVRLDADLGMADAGTWELLADGSRLWRLRLASSGARSLNLHLDRFDLPEGARLWVYEPSRGSDHGPYTRANRTAEGGLWTPVVRGDELVIEAHIPAGSPEVGDLHVAALNWGYRFFYDEDLGRSGACNNDVVCPEGNPWRAQIRSVAVYSLGGGTLCTGQMLNDVPQDFKPYFLTAYHCGVTSGNAGSLVVYWNFESPTCGQHGGGSLADNQTGSTFRARSSPSDFCLVELSQQPTPAFNVYYSGWNADGGTPTGAVAIHHPNTDEKSISFDNDPLTPNTYLSSSANDGTHWRIGSWDDGTTEPGSSGSGIWDPADGRLMGQLHGGYASCSSQTSDWYGRFDVSFIGGGSAATRLSDWLDPSGTGTTTIPGADPAGTAPVADFNGNPTSGAAPLNVAFTDLSTGAPTSWAWTFGDGGTSTSQSPSHVYGAAGSYTVALTATNATGPDTETKVGYINVTGAAPVAEFSGNPTSGTAPLNVAFTDLSTGAPTSWAWTFGDGGTSASQSPGHVYAAAGSYTVALTATNATGPDTETKVGYITVTATAVARDFLVGQGLGQPNPNQVKLHDAAGAATPVSFQAYSAGLWGVNVSAGDLNGGAYAEILTGPGPGDVFGPHVRGFLRDSTPMGKVSFYAYGTLKYGVNVAGGNVDCDPFAEVLTGAGPGDVFGPHVRGFNVDGGAATPITKISFFAYGTLKYGVNVAAGDIDGDGYEEILTAPGPGPTFAGQVKAFNFDCSVVAAIPGVSFAATSSYGANVAGGSVDGDVFDEIAVAPGPGPGACCPSRFRGYNYDGAAVTALAGFDVQPFSTTYGGRVGLGQVTGSTEAELLAGAGRDPAADATVRSFTYQGGVLTAGAGFNPFPARMYGVNVDAGAFGY